MNLRTIENIYHRTKSYIERNGFAEATVRSIEGLQDSARDIYYSKEAHIRENDLKTSTPPIYKWYKISLLVPAYNTNEIYLKKLLKSIAHQSYENIEVIIADASDSDVVKNTVDSFISDDVTKTEIHYYKLDENKGISENTNAALRHASGEFIALVDHDDFLNYDAISQVVAALQEDVDIVYTDEDKYYDGTDKYFSPNRKPDLNWDLLLSNNYICHLFVVRREIAEAVGGFSIIGEHQTVRQLTILRASCMPMRAESG